MEKSEERRLGIKKERLVRGSFANSCLLSSVSCILSPCPATFT